MCSGKASVHETIPVTDDCHPDVWDLVYQSFGVWG